MTVKKDVAREIWEFCKLNFLGEGKESCRVCNKESTFGTQHGSQSDHADMHNMVDDRGYGYNPDDG